VSPVGLDVKKHQWACFNYNIPDGNPHDISVVLENPGFPTVWYVTRVQAFAAAAQNMSIQGPDPTGVLVVLAGGCLELLPGGAYRDHFLVQGQGGRIIIEYWYPTVTQGNPPGIFVT
jgi:hypothetical protein